ncbi:endodeoxyribonuclease [Dimargaris xerosporica]|nr:endodeoxyribonuclease [Dimargaris xerosporica]
MALERRIFCKGNVVATIRVLEIIHGLLTDQTHCTKRDIFYQDVNLFHTQATVDKVVTMVAQHLQVPWRKLNIVSMPRGLAKGALKIVSDLGIVHDYSTLTSNSDVDYTLKDPETVAEATFNHLVSAQFVQTFSPCLIVTGKGYPDVSTRRFLHKLAEVVGPQCPMYCLVDGDPSGLEILCTYKFGSKALAYDRNQMAIPHLYWIGIHHEDLTRYPDCQRLVVPLTRYDRSKIQRLLQRPDIQHQPGWRHQLQSMLQTQTKSEIQCVYSNAQPNLLHYLEWKLSHRDLWL